MPGLDGGDQFGEVLLLVGGDQDRRHIRAESVSVNLLNDVETALLAEINIHEGHVGPQFFDAPQPSAEEVATATTLMP